MTYLRPLQFGAGGKKWLQSIYHHTNKSFTCFLYDKSLVEQLHPPWHLSSLHLLLSALVVQIAEF